MIVYTILGLVALIALAGLLFINLSPEFGGEPTVSQKQIYKESPQYKNGKFHNAIPTPMKMGPKKMLQVMFEFWKGAPGREPESPLPMQKVDPEVITTKSDTLTRLTWFGHSAFLLEIAGKNILIDPMFGETPAPIPLLGPQRFNQELPIAVDQLPAIDAVIFSHDHYDHLDYGTIQKLKDKVGQFYMPLGVGAHLQEWGVSPQKIHEVDWWQKVQFEGLTFISTPARHFSGRGLGDRFSTLWCGWIISNDSYSIYFSGDSGYGPHFKEIGEKYGPFDFAMIECGQYNERWKPVHMMPEESAQAALDLKAKVMMPIHWGAFSLAFHHWKDPVRRVIDKAEKLNMSVSTPKIGEPVILNTDTIPQEAWWNNI